MNNSGRGELSKVQNEDAGAFSGQFPANSLPKGGSTIVAFGQKVHINPATNTAPQSIPLPFSPGLGSRNSALSSFNSPTILNCRSPNLEWFAILRLETYGI